MSITRQVKVNSSEGLIGRIKVILWDINQTAHAISTI